MLTDFEVVVFLTSEEVKYIVQVTIANRKELSCILYGLPYCIFCCYQPHVVSCYGYTAVLLLAIASVFTLKTVETPTTFFSVLNESSRIYIQ